MKKISNTYNYSLNNFNKKTKSILPKFVVLQNFSVFVGFSHVIFQLRQKITSQMHHYTFNLLLETIHDIKDLMSCLFTRNRVNKKQKLKKTIIFVKPKNFIVFFGI